MPDITKYDWAMRNYTCEECGSTGVHKRFQFVNTRNGRGVCFKCREEYYVKVAADPAQGRPPRNTRARRSQPHQATSKN